MRVSSSEFDLDLWPATSVQSWSAHPQEAFLDWIASVPVIAVTTRRQFRESSVKTYTAMFKVWCEFLEGRRTHLLEATPRDAEDFFGQVVLEPVSRRRYLQLLDRVYHHIRLLGVAQLNPFTHELAKESELVQSLPPGLTPDEQAALVASLLEEPGWRGLRDRALLALLLGAGLRNGEAVSLTASAVDSDFVVRVATGGVHRPHTTLLLPDGPWREWWSMWLEARTSLTAIGALACPATQMGRGFSTSGLFRCTARWFEQAEISPAQRGANILRNTFARNALASNRYSLEDIQEFMGHEEIRSTCRTVAMPMSA